MAMMACRNDRGYTAALMAVLLNEPDADACIAVLEAENDLVISAGNLLE